MLSSLEDITARIVERYEPDRIILFGSRSRCEETGGSDIDLLIMKESIDRPIDRRRDVERLLLDRVVPVDLFVYTPEEVRYLFSLGSPFIEEIMETGRLLYMKKPTEGWLQDAGEECEAAGILLDHGKYRSACYHSQQCVEKGLKAMIIEGGKRPERIHDIIGLLNAARDMGFEIDLSSEDAVFLNSVYKGRYPTEEGLLPHGSPSKEDAERSCIAADLFLQGLRKRLSPDGG